MRMLRRGPAVVLLAAMATVLAPASPAQWRLWPSFHDDTEALDQEQPVEAGDLATDARYAVLRTAPRRPGYLLSFDATRFAHGTIERRWPVRTSVEIGGSAPPDQP